MRNKYSTFEEIKNRVITPTEINEALENLPFNFMKPTLEVLTQWKEAGEIEKIYSVRYITMIKARDNDSFNEEIMFALLVVALEAMKSKKLFQNKKKKTSKTK